MQFLKTNHTFDDFLKSFMWITYPFLSCKLAASFLTFSIFIFLRKKGKSLWRSFSVYRTSISRKYPISLFLFYFSKKSILKIRRFFIFIISFHALIIRISMNSITYSTSDTFIFMKGISISVNWSNFTLVFLKVTCHEVTCQETYFEISRMHQLTIMYRFEHANHRIILIFLFENLLLYAYSASVMSFHF